MRKLTVANAIDGSPASAGAAVGAAIDLTAGQAPFLPGYSCVVCIAGDDDVAATSFSLQGSQDGTTGWANIDDEDGNDVLLNTHSTRFFQIDSLPPFIRWAVTALTGAAGTASITLLGN